MKTILLSAAALAVALGAARAPAQERARPQLYVVRDVRLEDRADAPHVAIVLRNGRIQRVLEAGAAEPDGARAVDGKGMLAVPAFVDACTWFGCAVPEPKPERDIATDTKADVDVDMREANRKGIQPAFLAAEVLELPKDKLKAWRETGFCALLSAPHGQILSGSSALAVTRDAAPRDAVVLPQVFAHAAFRASGPGYPSTLMGYTAQLRQFMLDAKYVEMLGARADAGKSGPRPPFDRDLAAAAPILARSRRVACEADTARDIRRWMALGDELGFDIAILGGREAWKVAPELAARRIPVILTLEWGEEAVDPHAKEKEKKPEAKPGEETKPPEGAIEPPKPAETGEKPAEGAQAEPKQEAAKADDKKAWEYEEPLAVREEKRRLWEQGRDCAKQLSAAGVEFAFGSAGANATDLLKKVRQLVEAGLPQDVALAALTRGAATIVGAPDLGAIEAGRAAALGLWTAQPLTKDAKLAWLFVDGFPYEFEIEKDAAGGKPDAGVDATGDWTFTFTGGEQTPPPEYATLTMSPDGDVKGTLRATSPIDQQELTCDLTGHVSGKELKLSGAIAVGGMNIEFAFRGQLAGDDYDGEATFKGPFGEENVKVKGVRKPKREGDTR